MGITTSSHRVSTAAEVVDDELDSMSSSGATAAASTVSGSGGGGGASGTGSGGSAAGSQWTLVRSEPLTTWKYSGVLWGFDPRIDYTSNVKARLQPWCTAGRHLVVRYDQVGNTWII